MKELFSQFVELPLKENEFSPLHRISDKELLAAIACPGFKEKFALETSNIPLDDKLSDDKKYRREIDPLTQAEFLIKELKIADKNGKEYNLRFTRDLDNLGIYLYDKDSNLNLIKFNLRDRHCDGDFSATPPFFLSEIPLFLKHLQKNNNGNFSNLKIPAKPLEIPSRSKKIGTTNWYYSALEDKIDAGKRGVEFSIVSSHPDSLIAKKLEVKADKLYSGINLKSFAEFIDDPFAFIPFKNPTEENLSLWWKYWFQVVNRGLRGKIIPYPGQTSQNSFNGFFNHILEQSRKLLKSLGFTHLSGVPTWYYVWQINIAKKFQPDNQKMHQETLDFFKNLWEIEIPNSFKNSLGRSKLFSVKELTDQEKINKVKRDPLLSWFATAPYVLMLNPEFTPQLNLKTEHNESFKQTLINLKTGFTKNGKISHYPLFPGRNLWHSLEL